MSPTHASELVFEVTEEAERGYSAECRTENIFTQGQTNGMKIPRDLRFVQAMGLRRTHQVGSHIILETETPSHQRPSSSEHKTLIVGRLGNILRAVAAQQNVSRELVLEAVL